MNRRQNVQRSATPVVVGIVVGAPLRGEMSAQDARIKAIYDQVCLEQEWFEWEQLAKGIDGEPDPRYMAPNPDAGKYNEKKIKALLKNQRAEMVRIRWMPPNYTDDDFASGPQHGTLGDYLVGPKIRRLYAHALDTPVHLSEIGSPGNAGLFDSEQRRIHINTRTWMDRDALLTTLLHEGAHAVQVAKGRDADMAYENEEPNTFRQKEMYQNAKHEVTARRMTNFARLGLDENYGK
jgi:hypothetical protein